MGDSIITDSGDQTITDDAIESVAEETLAHRRTVERRLLGLPVRGRVSERVDAALERRGLITMRAR